MNSTVVSIILVGILIGGAVFFSRGSSAEEVAPSVSNVSMVDGKQIVEIGVKAGYSPKLTAAKGDMPTVLRMKTNGTFDCSSGVTIPSLGLRKILPSDGVTDIEIPAQKTGSTLKGLCVMGMYNFEVQFKG